MDKESVEDLRFDRRLRNRPDWIQDADLEAYNTSLPDVSEKMTTCGAEEEEKTTEAAAAPTTPTTPTAATIPTSPATPPQSTETAVPTAGDFSTPRPFGGFGSESGGN